MRSGIARAGGPCWRASLRSPAHPAANQRHVLPPLAPQLYLLCTPTTPADGFLSSSSDEEDEQAAGKME